MRRIVSSRPWSRPASPANVCLLIPLLSLVSSFPLRTVAAQDRAVPSVTITVTVVDQATGRPLGDVTVRIPELGIDRASDSTGAVVLHEIPLGTYDMLLARDGYEGVQGRFRVDQHGAFQVGLSAVGGMRLIGSVEAREGRTPIAGAIVRIEGVQPALTDDAGRFVVEGITPGRHAIDVEYLGRAPVSDTLEIFPGELVGVVVRLEDAPIPVEGLEVVVEPRSLVLDRAGFYQRRDASGIDAARFTRWDFQLSGSNRITDVLQNIPSIRIMSVLSPPGAIMRINRMGNRWFGFDRPANALPGCEPMVYVNDILYEDDPNPGVGHPRVRDMNFLAPGVIEGIEVYTGLTAPARYDADGCGVVLMWTRGY